MRPALVLIDLQRDYLDRPGLVPGEQELLRGVAALLEGCRGAGVPVFHAMTLVHADGANRMPHWKEAGTWACVEGTPGARPPAAAAPIEGEPLFAKDFYSAFDSPGLAAALAAGAVDTVILAGIYTHACVRATALDAYRHGYRVLIATDAIGSTDREHARLSLAWLEGRGSHGLPTAGILAMLAPVAAARQADAQAAWRHCDPASRDEILFEVPEASATQVAAAVARARGAGAWGQAAPAERLARLSRWRDALEAARDPLVALLVRDVAKPVVEARAEFDYAMALLRHALESFAIEERPEARTRVLVRHRPVGTVALVTPWNNPLAIAVGKLAPALAWGNTAVWKPALPGTRIARAVVDALEAAGLADMVPLVTGGAEAGRHLVRHPGIDAVSFTGSLAAGRIVAAACGEAGRPLQAELGGNNAVIVMAGIDVEAVASEVAAAAFSFSGQRCTAPRRLVVDEAIRGPFEEALVAATRALVIGDPGAEATRIGPLISRGQQERVAALVASPSGGRVLCGGRVPPGFERGCWLEPAIVADPDPASFLVREEGFGPVAVLLRAGGIDEAIALANGVEHGLVASLFSNDSRHRELFLAGARAGMLAVNQARPAFDAAAPFGGWKRSGHGPPEHGRWDREFYARPQAIYG